MLRIEFEPVHESDPCACCSGATIALTRFVYRDDVAHAVYYARFSKGHPELPVIATVSIGEWGEGSVPEQRVAFALELRSTDSQYQVMITDAEQSTWRESKVLGRTLDRAEALTHPLLPEVFHITDHMVSDDATLKAHLNAS